MKVETTLTSDEYAILSEVPGRSAQQRIRWLIKFYGACIEEKAQQDKAAAKAAVREAMEYTLLTGEQPTEEQLREICQRHRVFDQGKVAP